MPGVFDLACNMLLLIAESFESWRCSLKEAEQGCKKIPCLVRVATSKPNPHRDITRNSSEFRLVIREQSFERPRLMVGYFFAMICIVVFLNLRRFDVAGFIGK